MTESVEEFLARGGKITHVPTGYGNSPESKKLTQEEVRDLFRQEGRKRARAAGRWKDGKH